MQQVAAGFRQLAKPKKGKNATLRQQSAASEAATARRFMFEDIQQAREILHQSNPRLREKKK